MCVCVYIYYYFLSEKWFFSIFLNDEFQFPVFPLNSTALWKNKLCISCVSLQSEQKVMREKVRAL